MTNRKHATTPWYLVALLAFALAGPLGCGDDDSGGNNNNVADDAGVDAAIDGTVDATTSNAPYPGAPPNMPHAPSSCSMNCLTCHSAGVAGAPITPHPERLMCLQCHLPQNDVPNFVGSTFNAFP